MVSRIVQRKTNASKTEEQPLFYFRHVDAFLDRLEHFVPPSHPAIKILL